ncbi:hypothetical protein K432DRAFT_426449 [Lepidopterella palustris CBS 459.81]|uniref:Actin-like ATPase domain-containing protein n=1 Tax=Lepidopterella palustris CBS 459.81 TaxID=1314670 RepID=A0A8E2E8W3_9PEZI|nr:hypothetical protein K432DRAFT_426449 [Lepidopterella palustris CBS 459.81]
MQNNKMEDGKPHMVVGVDFGMTCTGVSYANLSIGSSTVRWIQKWPGRSQANENKVPTILVYPLGQSEPSSWGFLSETAVELNSEDKEHKEWFKTYLDPYQLLQKQAKDPEAAPKSLAEVEKCYEDYFRKLYQCITHKLGHEISGASWEDARIEFIFSVPTTWAPNPTVENFRTIVNRAGFGTLTNHTVSIGLTEAEAAAVHVSTEASGIFRERDILLVCDAGGGTTDLSVLRVTDTQSQSISLEQLDVVFGETIGSAAIDYDFEKLVQSRLEQANSITSLPILPEEAAWEMMKSREFQNIKCDYGSPDDTPLFSVRIPRLPSVYSVPEMRIKDGEMTFSREDLQKMFDRQIGKLFRLIDSQLSSLYRKFPDEQVAHIVLSGGLGNSAYVQQQLRARYSNSVSAKLPNASTLQVRIAPDPQLAVCKGIVADRVRKLLTNKAVLGWRCCRASYGTICKVLYNKKNPEHFGKSTIKDPLNNKLYITQAIAWFIKKGEAVSTDEPIIHNFVRRVTPGDPRRAFPTSIITSDIDAQFLPYQMNNDTRIICEIQSDLSGTDEKRFIEMNKRFWKFGKHYLKVEYQVRVIIGPADIRFELWFNNQKLSRDQPIRVEWVSAPAPPPAPISPFEESVLILQSGLRNGSQRQSVGTPNASTGSLARGISRITFPKYF